MYLSFCKVKKKEEYWVQLWVWITAWTDKEGKKIKKNHIDDGLRGYRGYFFDHPLIIIHSKIQK